MKLFTKFWLFIVTSPRCIVLNTAGKITIDKENVDHQNNDSNERSGKG